MSHPGPDIARRHLRLAGPPAERSRDENRALLAVRATLAIVALFFLTVAALLSTALALAPVAWRRAPIGGRLRPLRAREARIIPFQPRQRALPR